MNRRVLAVAVGVSAAVAVSASAQAPASKKLVPLAKLFPYLDKYLALPPGERSAWTLAYVIKLNGAPAKDLKMSIVDGGRREPLTVGPDGRVERLPTPAELKSGQAEIEAAPGSKFSLSMTTAATLRPAPELRAADLATAVRQADAGAHKAAGMLGMMLPKLERAVFPGATGAEAVTQDGGRIPLPGGAEPYADLGVLGKATTIRFTRPPSIIGIDDLPKKK